MLKNPIVCSLEHFYKNVEKRTQSGYTLYHITINGEKD